MKTVLNYLLASLLCFGALLAGGCSSDNEPDRVLPISIYSIAWMGGMPEICPEYIELSCELAEDTPQHPMNVTLTEAGSLERVLSDQNTTGLDALTISGPMDYNDCQFIVTLAAQHYLINLDLKNAVFENNIIPQRAFYLGFLTSIPIFNIVLPNNVNIGENAFCNVLIRHIEFSKKLSELSDGCFMGNILGSGSLVIPDGVKIISSYSFSTVYYEVEALGQIDEIIIPSSVGEIGYEAFSGHRVNSVTCKATTPPACKRYKDEKICNTSTLYVPVGSREKFAAAPGWSDIENIIERDDI